MSIRYIKYLLVAIITIFVLYSCGKFVHKHHYEPSRLPECKGQPFDSGRLLFSALNKYFDDNGRYPDMLVDLVPDYIDNIPPPEWGAGEWKYDVASNKQGYNIRVRYEINDYTGFVGSNGIWAYDH